MKYYEIKCETPYCGEDNYYYYKSDKEDKKAFLAFIDECLNEIVEWTKVYINNPDDIPNEMDREIKEYMEA